MEKIDYDRIIRERPWILEKGHKFVISPDADGIYCAIILTYFLDWKLVGFYDADVLAVKKQYKDDDIIYVDVEIFDAATKSMGNHCLLPCENDKFNIKGTLSNCINPNLIRNTSFSNFKEKYPFGTSHLILSILAYARRKKLVNLSRFLKTPDKSATFMYADGMIVSEGRHSKNWDDWFNYLRFNERWNPFHYSDNIKRIDFRKAANKFHRMRDGFTKTNQRGDRLSLLNKKKKCEALTECNDGTFSIKEENKDSVVGFMETICGILGIKFKKDQFDCWDSLETTFYERKRVGKSQKDFKKMLNEKPISFAYTDSQTLYYTIRKEDL